MDVMGALESLESQDNLDRLVNLEILGNPGYLEWDNLDHQDLQVHLELEEEQNLT